MTNFQPSPVSSLEGKATQVIKVALMMNLKVHDRDLQNVHFSASTMKHDIILGRK